MPIQSPHRITNKRRVSHLERPSLSGATSPRLPPSGLIRPELWPSPPPTFPWWSASREEAAVSSNRNRHDGDRLQILLWRQQEDTVVAPLPYFLLVLRS